MIATIDHGTVRELRLDRPPTNALSPDLIEVLVAAVKAAPREGARALVISGAPGIYSAGLDLPLLLALDRVSLAEAWGSFYLLLHTLASSAIPIAAAITGEATAGGFVIPLFCDWRVLARGPWQIGLNEVQMGLPLPPLVFRALERLVGPRQAERLAVGGLFVSTYEAAACGLVDELVSGERVVRRAISWCRDLIRLPPQAMTSTRRMARADLLGWFEGLRDGEVDQVLESWSSAEATAAMRGVAAAGGRKR